MPKALSEYEKNIGKKVRDYRITNDIRQEQLAKYLNLPLQVISRMENGKRRITVEELQKIALFFDEPIQLFTKDEYKYIYPLESAYGVFPVYMDIFFDDYAKGLGVDPGKDNFTNKCTKKFIEAIKSINNQIISHQKFREKQRESNNLR